MKKHLLSVIAALSASAAFAQLPVSTSPENKKAVLEEYTGIYCGYCPDGHQIANSIYNADPTNVVLINIHSGPFAAVAPGEPDLTTPEGTAIDGMPGMGITGYPAGDMNRTILSGTVMSNGRNYWQTWANIVKGQTAYCNVALQGSLNVVTRVLTVEAQVYYTGSSPVATNALNIFLLEDAVNGPQHNYGNPYWNLSNYNADGSYNHNHVLRKALTTTFGKPITTTSTGSMFTYTTSYTVPLTYGAAGKTNPCQLGNLKLVAFVTETNTTTINANHGPITLTGFSNEVDAGLTSITSDNSVCTDANLSSSFKFTNYGSDTITSADFDYGIDNTTMGTVSWAGTLPPMSTSQAIDIPAVSFSALQTNSLVLRTVDVNGENDQNSNNNFLYKPIPFSTYADSTALQMDFTQDEYGTESTWFVVDATGTSTLASGGPYQNLAGLGTALHTSTFVIDTNSCYSLIVKDAYGDGINSNYGAGGYKLKVVGASTNIINSNGAFGTEQDSQFSTIAAKTNTTVLETAIATNVANISSVKIYPNPARDLVNLAVSLAHSETLNISVINLMGEEIYSIKQESMNSGANTVAINTQSWSTGVYFIKVSSPKGAVNQKLIITK